MNPERKKNLALAILHSANAIEDLAYLIDKDRDKGVVKARTEQARRNLREAQHRLDALSYDRTKHHSVEAVRSL